MMRENFDPPESASSSVYLYGWGMLCFYTAFIVYASIVPFDHWAIPSQPIPYDFLYGWQKKIHLFDIYQNLLFYMPLGFLIALISQKKRHFILRLLLCFIFAFMLSTTLELTQSFHTTRVSSLLDVILNTLSSLMGGIVGCLLTIKAISWDKIQLRIFKTDTNQYLVFATTILLFVGIAYHLYPYLPTLQYSHIKTGIKPLFVFWSNPDIFNIQYFIKYFIQGILLYITGYVLFKPNFRIVLLLLLITTILSLKIVVISRYISMESLSGLVSAVVLCALIAWLFRYCFKSHHNF